MRRLKTIGRVKVMAQSCGLPVSSAIYEKTPKEVSKGTMAGPYSLNEMADKHGKFVNIIPSFGPRQGTDEKGKPKFRRIDDHTAGHTNPAQKIRMSMVDYVMVMLAGAAKHTQAKLVIGTEDMVDTGKFHCWIAKSVSPSQERATRTHDRSNSSSSSVNRLAPRLP